MSCKYHPEAGVAGGCKCGNKVCSECASVAVFGEGKNKFHLCLDCAAKFARKRLLQSYVAAAIGFILGLFMSKDLGFHAPVLLAYMFWGTFFGWFYGQRIWTMLCKIESEAVFFGLLPFRITFAMLVGMFGGGIAQFLLYRKILKQQQLKLASAV